MKYKVKITRLGNLALDFLPENMIIIFNDNAPPELAEISALHEIGELKEEVCIGDILFIGNQKFKITSVGDEVNHTLKTLGHCTIKFNSATQAELPGILHVEENKNVEINIGDYIIIE